MKGAKKPRRTEKKVAQKTLKERRVAKRAASNEQARDNRGKL
jgi:hypothetical protein